MWYIYTMEYYIAEKNNILKFSGKLIDLENIIFHDFSQTQIDKYLMYSLINDFWIKSKENCLRVLIPANIDINEEPKRGIHGSNLHGK